MRDAQHWMVGEARARAMSCATHEAVNALIAQIGRERRAERLLECAPVDPNALAQALAHWRWGRTTPPLGALSVWTAAGEQAPVHDHEWAALEALERYTLTHEVKKGRSAERTCESVRAMARAGAAPVREGVRKRAIQALRCGHALGRALDASGEALGAALARADDAWRSTLGHKHGEIALIERAGRPALMWRIPMWGMTEAAAHSNARFTALHQAQRWQATHHEVAIPAQAKSGLGESRETGLAPGAVERVREIAEALEREVRGG